jgi:hypothetical protein
MSLQKQLPKRAGLAAHASPIAVPGECCTFMMSRGRMATIVYVQLDPSGQATTAATDVVSWYTYAGSSGYTVTGDTSANQTLAAGLPMTGGNAAIAVSYYFWTQVRGGRILAPDGSTAIGNTLLGDGSVANKESLMYHASTDGMVDTWATDAGKYIGVAMEDDSPGISLFNLGILVIPF